MEKNHRANEREMNFKLFGGFHDTYKTLIEANAKTRLFTPFFFNNKRLDKAKLKKSK